MSYRDEMAQKTKEKIMMIAADLFEQNGYDNVSVSEIIRAAKISNGCFYGHFKNKEALLNSTVIYVDQYYLEYYNNVLCGEENADKNALIKLKMFMKTTSQVITQKGPADFRLYMAHAIRNPELLSQNDRNYTKILQELILECRKNHLINDMYNNLQLTQMLLFINRGIAIEWSLQNGSYPITETDELIDIFLEQIKA